MNKQQQLREEQMKNDTSENAAIFSLKSQVELERRLNSKTNIEEEEQYGIPDLIVLGTRFTLNNEKYILSVNDGEGLISSNSQLGRAIHYARFGDTFSFKGEEYIIKEE